MATKKTNWDNALATIQGFLVEPLTTYSLIVALSISIFIVLEVIYPHFVTWTSSIGIYWFQENYPIFVTSDDREFSKGFVEWFGVFYGFLLPLLLIRAWEQLDLADRQFDQEADAIRTLLEDIMLLDDSFIITKRSMVEDLQKYIQHIVTNYKIEHRVSNGELRKQGDSTLQGIRTNYKSLIYRGGGKKARQLEPVTTELLNRLNEAIDARGDRISTFSQRLFESLKFVAIVTSLIWLIPFYFLDYQSGVFGSLLKLSVTFLIIFVLSIIHDLDEPFNGPWQISTASWEEVEKETNLAWEALNEKKNEVSTRRDNEGNNNNPAATKTKPARFALLKLLWAGALTLIYLRLVPPKSD